MNEERFVLTDDVWLRLAPHLPGKEGDAGVTGKDNRLFLEAVLWRVRTGLPWRDLPAYFGNWNSVFRRFRRWAEGGVFERIFKEISIRPVEARFQAISACQFHGMSSSMRLIL